jgi:recombination protein RecT
MANELVSTKSLFERDDVKKKFQELMGKNATAFITSVLQIVSSNEKLKKADPTSVYQSAAMAATLNLPLNNNLGFAYIVPYKQKRGNEYVDVAQFQLGYKGFIQLAQRSGQFKELDSKEVYEGQHVEDDTMKGFHFEWKQKKSDKIIGFVAWFKLINGYEAILYMTTEQLKSHGLKYSQTFKSGFGLWKDDFESMAKKTVIKLLLAKFAPLSVDMQKAVLVDQSIVNDAETQDVTYVDNIDETRMSIEEQSKNVETDRIKESISKMNLENTTPVDIDIMRGICKEDKELSELLEEKIKSLSLGK